jgi:hypothetical protein
MWKLWGKELAEAYTGLLWEWFLVWVLTFASPPAASFLHRATAHWLAYILLTLVRTAIAVLAELFRTDFTPPHLRVPAADYKKIFEYVESLPEDERFLRAFYAFIPLWMKYINRLLVIWYSTRFGLYVPLLFLASVFLFVMWLWLLIVVLYALMNWKITQNHQNVMPLLVLTPFVVVFAVASFRVGYNLYTTIYS